MLIVCQLTTMMMIMTMTMIIMIVLMIWEWFSPWKVSSTCPSPGWRQVDLRARKVVSIGVHTSSDEQTLLKNKNWATCGFRHLPLLHQKKRRLHRHECILLCRGRAENQGTCLESHTWDRKWIMSVVEIRNLFTCPPSHGWCICHPYPQSWQAPAETLPRRLPLLHFEG